MVQEVATVPLHFAIGVEDGDAARAALVVALVGGHKTGVVQPSHSIGFAQQAFGGLAGVDDAVAGAVNVLQVHGARREVLDDLAFGHVHQHDVVVLLQGHDGNALGVDLDQFGLGIVRSDLGQAVQGHGVRTGAIGHAGSAQGDDGEVATGQLGNGAFVELLIALVFHHDDGVARALVQGNRIGLAEQRASAQRLAAGQVKHREVTGGLREVFGGIDSGQYLAVGNGHRGGLAFHRQEPGRFGLGGVADINQANAHLLAIGVGQCHAVGADRHNFGHRLFAHVAPCRHIAVRLKGSHAVEIGASGRSLGGSAHTGQQGQRRHDGGERRHENSHSGDNRDVRRGGRSGTQRWRR